MSYTREDVLKATRNLTGKTIPVHVEIRAPQVILSQPEMRQLLAAAETIAVGNCVCREEERNCDGPLEVCLSLDAEARQKITDRNWREISREDALNLLEETYELGLVHMAYRRAVIDDGGIREGEISFVCSCCTCCCWPLNGLRQYDYHDAITESAYVVRFDAAKCVGCGTCAERCPFDAFALPDGANRATYTEHRCFGCGLCVETCPSSAIHLAKRGSVSAELRAEKEA